MPGTGVQASGKSDGRKDLQLDDESFGLQAKPVIREPGIELFAGLRIYMDDHMPDPDSDPSQSSPAVVAGVVFAAQVIGLVIAGSVGALSRMSEGVQFFLGAEAIGFPLIIYLLLKKRRERGE